MDYNVLRKIEAIEPRIKTGYIMYLAIGNLEELDIDFYSVERSNVSESFVEKAHAIGREVHVWTINDGNDFEELLEIGVDNIITDKITLLRERLSKIKEYKNKLFNKNK